MSDIYNAAGILNTALMLCLIIGGSLAIRSGKQQQAGSIQSQVIDALKAELETLQRRVDSLEKENTRLTQIMSLIKQALRKRGLTITIDGDLVTIDDGRGSSSQYSHIQEESE
jgi:cell division protein FtsB